MIDFFLSGVPVTFGFVLDKIYGLHLAKIGQAGPSIGLVGRVRTVTAPIRRSPTIGVTGPGSLYIAAPTVGVFLIGILLFLVMLDSGPEVVTLVLTIFRFPVESFEGIAVVELDVTDHVGVEAIKIHL